MHTNKTINDKFSRKNVKKKVSLLPPTLTGARVIASSTVHFQTFNSKSFPFNLYKKVHVRDWQNVISDFDEPKPHQSQMVSLRSMWWHIYHWQKNWTFTTQ